MSAPDYRDAGAHDSFEDGALPFHASHPETIPEERRAEFETAKGATETITWVPVADELPDADLTVNVTLAEGAGEPVWLGYFDGAQWLDVDAMPIEVIAWAPMLKGAAALAMATRGAS